MRRPRATTLPLRIAKQDTEQLSYVAQQLLNRQPGLSNGIRATLLGPENGLEKRTLRFTTQRLQATASLRRQGATTLLLKIASRASSELSLVAFSPA